MCYAVTKDANRVWLDGALGDYMMRDTYLDEALSRKNELITEMIKEKEAEKVLTGREREFKNVACKRRLKTVVSSRPHSSDRGSNCC